MTDPNPEILLTTQELADRLQVSTETIYRRVAAGMPCVEVGRAKRYRWDYVLAWLESEQQEATP